jgi:hypothetical protein
MAVRFYSFNLELVMKDCDVLDDLAAGSNDVLKFCKSITDSRPIVDRKRWDMSSLRRTFSAITAAFIDLVLYDQCDALPFVADHTTMPEQASVKNVIDGKWKPKCL